MIRDKFFITGMPRSGTTLLDKILSSNPEVIAFSQPMPLIFPLIKSDYLASINNSNEYPLNDLQYANYSPIDDWTHFLENFVVHEELCCQAFKLMDGFSGQYTKPQNLQSFLDGMSVWSPACFVSQYLEHLDCQGKKKVGFKETWCEEFAPYFLNAGFKVIFIIRDPRDVVCSLNYGRGKEFGGLSKPVLFNIRNWRKSVLIMLMLEQEENCHVIYYEDLVKQPDSTLSELDQFLEISPTDVASINRGIMDQSNRKWRSNSSFREYRTISDESVGNYRKFLPADLIGFIEACCFFELQALGYEIQIESKLVEETLSSFQPDEPLLREELRYFLINADRKKEEVRRNKNILKNNFVPQEAIHIKAFSALTRRNCIGINSL